MRGFSSFAGVEAVSLLLVWSLRRLKRLGGARWSGNCVTFSWAQRRLVQLLWIRAVRLIKDGLCSQSLSGEILTRVLGF